MPMPTVTLRFFENWPGWLHTQSWAGSTKCAVVVIGETPKSYIITPAGKDRVRLGGRQRWLEPDCDTRVPKYAVSKRKWRPGERDRQVPRCLRWMAPTSTSRVDEEKT